MFELFITAVILAFSVGYLCRVAASRGRSKVRWGLLSVLAYIGGAVLAEFVFLRLFAGSAPSGTELFDPIEQLLHYRETLIYKLLLAHIVGGISFLLIVYLFLRRMPQVAPMEKASSPSSSISEAPLVTPAERCSQCSYGESKSGREVWCTLKQKAVLWNDSCNQFARSHNHRTP